MIPLQIQFYQRQQSSCLGFADSQDTADSHNVTSSSTPLPFDETFRSIVNFLLGYRYNKHTLQLTEKLIGVLTLLKQDKLCVCV